MTAPTTHRFLRTLRDQSQIPQVGNSSAAVFEHHVIQLAATLRETVHVAVLDGNAFP